MSHCKLHLNSDRVSQSMWYTGRSCELPCPHTHTHTHTHAATHIFSLGPLPIYQIFCVTMDRTEKEANIWPRGRVTWLSSTSFQMKKRIYRRLMSELLYQCVIPLQFSFISFSELLKTILIKTNCSMSCTHFLQTLLSQYSTVQFCSQSVKYIYIYKEYLKYVLWFPQKI